MTRRTPRTIVVFIVGLIVLPRVSAHVTLEADQAPARSYFKAVFRVPHGCAMSPTVRLRVRMPEGVTSVKPQPKPGWKLDATRTTLSPPIDDGEGGKITEVISEVTWSEGRLPNEQFDEFAILMRLPNRAGETIYFPIVQECERGIHRWIEVPAAGKATAEGREPAPALRLSPGK
jgi:uncharacterized protein YcnI